MFKTSMRGTSITKKKKEKKEEEPLIFYDTYGSKNIESQFDDKRDIYNTQEFEYKKKKKRRLPGIKLLRELEKQKVAPKEMDNDEFFRTKKIKTTKTDLDILEDLKKLVF
jgi:hypothetical protein